MTTTVQVQARALGAVVSVNTPGEGGGDVEHRLASHEDRSFHLDAGQTITVSEGSAADHQADVEAKTERDQAEADRLSAESAAPMVDEVTGLDSSQVPGREENDKLVGNEFGKSRGKTSKFGDD